MTSPDACPFMMELLDAMPSLRSRARSLCRNQADAHDLVQDTIARALGHRHQFEPGTNLRAWVHRILFHLFVSNRRRAIREHVGLVRFASEGASSATGDPTRTTFSPRLEAAFQALPSKLATVVRRIDVDELSYREVAEEMNIPIGTVMSRLWRGRRRLAEAVSDDMLHFNAQAA